MADLFLYSATETNLGSSCTEGAPLEKRSKANPNSFQNDKFGFFTYPNVSNEYKENDRVCFNSVQKHQNNVIGVSTNIPVNGVALNSYPTPLNSSPISQVTHFSTKSQQSNALDDPFHKDISKRTKLPCEVSSYQEHCIFQNCIVESSSTLQTQQAMNMDCQHNVE